MNRKLVNGLLLLSVTTAGCGMFTSCKDTDEDFKNEIISGQVALDDKIKALEAAINAIKSCDCDKDALMAEISQLIDQKIKDGDFASAKDLAEVKAQLDALINETLPELTSKIDGKVDQSVYDAFLAAYQTTIDGINQQLTLLSNQYTELSGTVNTLQNELDGVKTQVAQALADAQEANLKAGEALALAQANAGAIENLQNEVADLLARIEALEAKDTEFQEKLDAFEGDLKQLKDDLANKVDKEAYDQLVEEFNAAVTRIAQNEEDINALYGLVERNQQLINQLQNQVNTYFSSLREALSKLVTSLVLNQVVNPVFGTVNLPVGLNTNILINYHGASNHALSFPFGDVNYEYNTNESRISGVSQAALANLRNTIKGGVLDITAGQKLMADDNNSNLGQLYLTINPNNVDFSGTKLQLIKSNGDVAPIALDAKRDKDYVLTFGTNLTRAENVDNGFYSVAANVDPANVEDITVDIEPGLKSAVKDALKDHTKQDFVKLAELVYRQFDGILPAYGVAATWSATNEKGEKVDYATISKYEIAATSFKPLSYTFFYDQSINHRLPTFSSVTDYLHEFFKDFTIDFKLNFDEIKGLDFKLDINEPNITIDKQEINIDLSGCYIVIDGKKYYLDGDTTITLTYNPTTGEFEGAEGGELNGLVDAIVAAMNSEVGGMIDSIKQQVNDQLIGQVNGMIDSINDQLNGLQGQIDDNVAKILKDIEDRLAGKLGTADKLIDLYNRLANRVNDMLADPNHYLQVMMAYKGGNGDLHRLSTSKYMPSRFVKGSGNAIELFATSYTAELLAPSFKKYVAVSNVFDAQGNELPNGIQLANAANEASKMLNTVRPGRQQRFALNLSGLTAGLTYEIVYTSVDYSGYVSTNVYYLTVAE